MGKIKGCSNETCVAHKKKTTYKESDKFCPKCGNALTLVCKDCKTQLSSDKDKYCLRCHAKRDDKKDKVKIIGGGAALALGGVVLSFGKKAIGIAAKFKG